jgi:DNA primase
VLYGLNLARIAIAKQERAVVVEGNTDVIALRQAGLEPVVASMGTALTEQQLKELQRLTRRLYLCFDADAAGEDATLRGMELAVRNGFSVRVVALPPGRDPADATAEFEERLEAAVDYTLYRVRLEIERAPDRQTAHDRVRTILDPMPDSPERHDAWRLANDELDMTVQIQARALTTRPGQVSKRVLEAGERQERDVLAACFAFPELLSELEELSPEHFDKEEHRALRAALLRRESGAAIAELDAVAATEAIDETTAKELLLRLRERHLRRELARAEPGQAAELQRKLLEVREAVAELV